MELKSRSVIICLALFLLLSGIFEAVLGSVDENFVAMSAEKRLIKRLLSHYKEKGKIGRPVRNVKDTVVVKYGLALIQILSLDEKNQILTVNVWAKYTWIDELLQWDPKNYSNVEEVRIPPSDIWTPDIVLYNYADQRLIEKRDVMLIVSSSGKIIWLPPAIFKSTCPMDISNFPFDYQHCHLKFGSWTYKVDKLDVQLYENLTEIDTKDYIQSNEWLVLHKPARRYLKEFDIPSNNLPDLTFFLFLKRNSAYHAYLLVVPCVLLSSLTLVIFWLPPESPAKMILGMNIFVAFSLLLRLLADTTPSASTSIPFLGYYYCLNMILITFSTFLSIIVINLYFRCDKRRNLPIWLRKGVNIVSTILGMHQVLASANSEKLHLIRSEIKNSRNHIRKQMEKETNESRETIPTPISPRDRQKFAKPGIEMRNLSGYDFNCSARYEYNAQNTEVTNIPDSAPPNKFIKDNIPSLNVNGNRISENLLPPKHITSAESKKGNQSVLLLEENLSEIRKALKNLMTKIADKDRGNRIAKEWRTVAMVLDRVFFWSYLCTITLSGLILLLPRGLPKTQEHVLADHENKFYPKNTF